MMLAGFTRGGFGLASESPDPASGARNCLQGLPRIASRRADGGTGIILDKSLYQLYPVCRLRQTRRRLKNGIGELQGFQVLAGFPNSGSCKLRLIPVSVPSNGGGR